jgi:hypothetical protein
MVRKLQKTNTQYSSVLVQQKKGVNPVNEGEEQQPQDQAEEDANCDTVHSLFQSKN